MSLIDVTGLVIGGIQDDSWLERWVVMWLFPESAKARSRCAQFHSFIYCIVNIYREPPMCQALC